MTYKDRTFCASPNCKNKCDRKMTEEQIKESQALRMEVSYAYFCNENGELLSEEERCNMLKLSRKEMKDKTLEEMKKAKYTLERINENTTEYKLDGILKYRHFKDEGGNEWWIEYDENNHLKHYENSDGYEWSIDNPDNPKNKKVEPEYKEPFTF